MVPIWMVLLDCHVKKINSMYKIQFVMFCFLLVAVANAQPDTTRIDTSWSRSPHRPFLLSIIQGPVLEGRSTAITIVPRERLCFDKIFRIKTQTASAIAEGCAFINTEKGFMASTPIKRGATPVCDLNIAKPDFGLILIGLKGNAYNYFNAKKNNSIEHWVTTGNSENYQYQFITTPEAVPLTRRAESKLFVGGKIKAWAYKAEGRPETWWLFGKTEPDRLLMTPKKFLGSYAVGYQYTDKGLFIIMQITAPNYSAEIMDIQDQDICFDPSSFKVFEDQHYTRGMESIVREREKLQKKEDQMEPGQCAGQERISINYQKEALNRRQENLERSRQGNIQQNISTQQAQAQSIINYDDVIQISIYETELDICKLQQRLSRQSGGGSSSQRRQQERLTCLRNQLTRQKATQQQLLRVNTQFANNPGKQYAEKAKLYMQSMVGCD
jgi:hypothetical protein